MLSGRRLDLLEPSPLDIEIGDIAHGLARVARWNGQTVGDQAYSVAQHSLAVEIAFAMIAGKATAEERMIALLHDAPEYVIGDMISPFKAVMGGAYKSVEKRLATAIHLRFALPGELSPTLLARIKRADQICAYFEATRLAGFTESEALAFFGRPGPVTHENLPIDPLAPGEAQARFHARFEVLDAERARTETRAE
ncbi:HD family hydrolase [Pararhizobium mangrovi]|nr:HD family hydrolase [Pararhizobium mangrovi]